MKKRKVQKIIITLRDEEHPERKDIIHTINILNGQRFRIMEFSSNFILYDSQKNIIREIRWQAGFTKIYEYSYGD